MKSVDTSLVYSLAAVLLAVLGGGLTYYLAERPIDRFLKRWMKRSDKSERPLQEESVVVSIPAADQRLG